MSPEQLQGRAHRPPHRRLLAGRRPLRDGDRAPAVRGEERGRADHGHPARRSRAPHPPAHGAARPHGPADRPLPGEGPRYRLPSAVDLGWELEQLAGRGAAGEDPRGGGPALRRPEPREGPGLPLRGPGRGDPHRPQQGRGPARRVPGASFRFRSREADVRETGRRLGVEALVHGSVRKSGDRLRDRGRARRRGGRVRHLDRASTTARWRTSSPSRTRSPARRARAGGAASARPSASRSASRRPATCGPTTTTCRRRKFFYQYSRKSMRFARGALSSGRSRSIPPTPGRTSGSPTAAPSST